MAEFIIDAWAPTATPALLPASSSDSQGPHRLWDLLDEAQYAVTVPSDYQTGTDINLFIHEATAGQSKKHKWQCVTLLNGAKSATFTLACTSPASANEMTDRTFPVTTAGTVGGTSIVAGDLLSVTVKRIAAADTEDPNAIRTYATVLVITELAEDTGSCLGRVAELIATVRSDFNESQQRFITNNQIIRYLNKGIEAAARRGYWKKETAINATQGTYEYDLISLITRFVDCHQVRWSEDTDWMEPAASWQEFMQYKLDVAYQIGTYPSLWFVQYNKLYIDPPPTAALAGGIVVLHSYLPAPLTCLETVTPEIPSSFDDYLVAAAMYRIVRRAYTENYSESLAQYWEGKAEALLNDLLHQGKPAKLSLRPYV